MEFDPDSNPPCYKTKDEVRIYNIYRISSKSMALGAKNNFWIIKK